MQQTLNVQCWKCSRTFHTTGVVKDDSGPYLVEKIATCPFCDKPNRIRVDARSVEVVEILRSVGDAGESVPLSPGQLPAGALLKMTIRGEVPEMKG